MEFCVYAGPDFITIDGRGGATGASPKSIRDSTSVPTIYALYTARKYLDQAGCGAQLNPRPLDEHAPVKTETIIGKHAAKPLSLIHISEGYDCHGIVLQSIPTDSG